MWLITTLTAALAATLASVISKNKYQSGFLSLMLWGATIMIFVDHLFGYNGGSFIEMETDGLVTNAGWLGILMLMPVILTWVLALLTQNFKKA